MGLDAGVIVKFYKDDKKKREEYMSCYKLKRTSDTFNVENYDFIQVVFRTEHDPKEISSEEDDGSNEEEEEDEEKNEEEDESEGNKSVEIKDGDCASKVQHKEGEGRSEDEK